jgi:hypothetical protein
VFYNGELLQLSAWEGRPNMQSLGFVDDIMHTIHGPSTESNAVELKRALNKAEAWRKKHGTRFKITKYILIHFTRNRTANVDTIVTIGEHTITPSKEVKYLDVVFEKEL